MPELKIWFLSDFLCRITKVLFRTRNWPQFKKHRPTLSRLLVCSDSKSSHYLNRNILMYDDWSNLCTYMLLVVIISFFIRITRPNVKWPTKWIKKSCYLSITAKAKFLERFFLVHHSDNNIQHVISQHILAKTIQVFINWIRPFFTG